MAYKSKFYNPDLINNNYYHLYNRGVAKQDIFKDAYDYRRLLMNFSYYLDDNLKSKLSIAKKDQNFRSYLQEMPSKPLLEIVSYCLMPNHFHLLVKQIADNGITTFIRRALNSYTRYYNIRHDRIGPMFQGSFRAVDVKSNEQLIHLSRYIHLNPFVGNLCRKLDDFTWSSYKDFLTNKKTRLSNPHLIIETIGSSRRYQDFVEDHSDYARKMHNILKLTIDLEE